jgi:gas vesicle protein
MGKSLIGFITGLAAGVVAGILLAPEKGSDTRKTIGKKSKKWADEGLDAFKNLANLSQNGNGHKGKDKKQRE